MKDFIEGLEILSRYIGDPDNRYFMEACHDIVYIQVSSGDLWEGSDDGKRLIKLGFHLEEGTWSWYT